MRLNRGTILLLVVCLVVIVGVLVLTINQAAAPGTETATPAAEATAVALFPGVDTGTIQRLEIRNNTTGERTVLLKQDQTWNVGNPNEIQAAQMSAALASGATEDVTAALQSTNYDVDDAQVGTLLGNFLDLTTADVFEADDLSQFGLTEPTYSVFALDSSGASYVLYIGDKNPNGTRFYGVIEQIASGDTSPTFPQMAPDLDRSEDQTSVDSVVIPGSTVPAPEGPVPNTSDVLNLQGTLTAMSTDDPDYDTVARAFGDMIETQNSAVGTAVATEDTSVPTAEATSAGTDLTPEASQQAVAQDVVRSEVQTSTTQEATAPVVVPTVIPGTESAEATAETVRAAAVHLEGPQTIYLLPASSLNPLIQIIDAPPLAAPTETPAPTIMIEQPEAFSTENPVSSEATAEATSAEPESEAATTAEATTAP